MVSKMEATLAQKAIDLALSGKWSEAVQANIEILKENPKDIDALNRAARAYAETGNVELARKTAAKVLKIDPGSRLKWCLPPTGFQLSPRTAAT